jgi:Fe2+ or Zn2+ uptake regulation protein
MSRTAETEIDAAIRQSGLRRTTPRAVVASVLHSHPGHHTVGEIEAAIEREHPDARGIARSSVYRALEALESTGLVVAVRSPQEEARFEWEGVATHHHLICDGCGGTSEVTLAGAHSLEQEARREHGFHARVRHLALRGTCGGCREASATAARETGRPR